MPNLSLALSAPLLQEGKTLHSACRYRKATTLLILLIGLGFVVRLNDVNGQYTPQLPSNTFGISEDPTIAMANRFQSLPRVAKPFQSFSAFPQRFRTLAVNGATMKVEEDGRRKGEEAGRALGFSCERRRAFGLSCVSLFSAVVATPGLSYAGPSEDFALDRAADYELEKKRALVAAGPCEGACFQECNDAAPGNESYCRSSCAAECAKVDSMDGTNDGPIIKVDGRTFGAQKTDSAFMKSFEKVDRAVTKTLNPAVGR